MTVRPFKITLTALFFSLFACAAWAQNGVPLGALRDNPYFADGSDFSNLPPEEQDQYQQENQAQYNDPNGENFYNSDNWQSGGMTSDTGSQFEEYTGSDADGDESAGENAGNGAGSAEGTDGENGEEEQPEVMMTDDELREILLGSTYNRSHFNVTVGFMPEILLPVGEKSIASYFKLYSSLLPFPLGGQVTAEAALGNGSIRGGPGLIFDYAYLYSGQKMYTLTASEFDGGIYGFVQWPFIGDFIFSARLGASGLFLVNLTQTYTNGLVNKSDYFFYPELFAGFSAKYYFYSFFGAGASVDFRWPFLMTEGYLNSICPRFQVTFSTCWRF